MRWAQAMVACMKLLRLALVVVLVFAVPGTALAALLNNGHCAAHQWVAAPHALHAAHAAHAKAPTGAGHADAQAAHCACGCACAGSHCVSGSAVALAIDAVAAPAAIVCSTGFDPLPARAAQAHSRTLLRPPSTT